MIDALDAGHEAIRGIIDEIDKLAAAAGKQKLKLETKAPAPELAGEVEGALLGPLADAMRIRDKLESYAAVDRVLDDHLATLPDDDAERRGAVKAVFKGLKERVLRDEVLERGQRLDGRKFDEIRTITADVGLLPRTHGSAVFTRGETQALVTATLGTADDKQKVELVDGEMYRRFMLHYNFPPFSVGEVKFLRGPGRREIGHGNLAERSLLPVLPEEEAFPYTIRVVSDILESNGSSSMASVCGGTLAMMDAGVPLAAPVAGVAMGLIVDEATGRPRRAQRHRRGRGPLRRHGLQGRRHRGGHHRPADGTSRSAGITPAIMREALEQARAGRLHILECMRATLPDARSNISTFAPRIVTIKIPVDKNPRHHRARRQDHPQHHRAYRAVRIDVEDDGTVNVASNDDESAQRALSIIEELTATPELNKSYLGTVQRITDFGAFVEVLPGVDGLLHVSEIAHYRVKDVRDELKEGEQVLVKVINVDPSGKIRLSRKALLDKPAGAPEAGQPAGAPAELGVCAIERCRPLWQAWLGAKRSRRRRSAGRCR